MNKEYKYDIAFSFAEEDFSIAEQIAEALREKGLSYYLYTEHVSEHLGKAIMKITQQVYGIDT